MPDLIITPGSGLIEFVKEGAQSPTVYRLEMAEGAGLILNAPLTSSVGMKAPNMMDSFGNNIFSGTSTFNGPTVINGNLSVFGTTNLFSASNVYISSSQLTIEDNILTLNAFSPFLRYAGIEMIDSGSGTLSSMLWDGQGDYFFLSGSSVNGKILTGPDGQSDLTSGYVPKATAGYKLGNSLIYDDGSRVGINTTAPSSSLTIQSNGTQLRLQTQSAPGSFFANIGSRYDSTRPFTIEVANNSSTPAEFMGIYADSGGANNRVVFPTGNIGIGTTNPTQKLEVAGYIMAGEGTYRTNIYASNGGAWIGFGDTSSLNSLGRIGAYGSLFNINSVNGDTSFQYNGSEKMRITTGGHLGLGIATPTSYVNANGNWFRPSLDGLYSSIYATTEAVVNLISSGSADGAAVGGVYFTRMRAQGDAHHQIAAIRAIQSGTSNTIAGGALQFFTKVNGSGTAATDPAMVIGSGGNVGIGSTNPNTKLHIYGSGGGFEFGVGSPNCFIETIDRASVGKDLNTAFYTRGTGSFTWHNGSYTERMRIDGNGNVGIGTATFAYASSNRGNLEIYGSTDSLIALRNSTANSYIQKSGNDFYLNNGGAGIIYFQNNGANRVVIDSNGNVGVGTTSPVTRLDVVGLNGSFPTSSGATQSTGSILRLRNGNSNLVLDIGGHGGNGNWIQSTNRSDLSINYPLLLNPNGGNVGIGSTSPGTKLDVAGEIRMPVIKQSTTLYTGTDITDDDSTRTVYFNIPSGGYSPSRYFKVARIKITGNYQNVSLNGYFSATNSTGLHVGSERKVEFDFIAYAATNPGAPIVTYLKRGPDTTTVSVYAVPSGSGAGTTHYDVYIRSGWYNDTDGELAIRVGYGSAVTVWQSGLDSGTSVPADTLVNPNSNYSFDTSGNIGIGSTSPAYKLDVGAAGNNNVSVRLTPGYERVRYYGFDLLGYNDGNLWMMGNNATNTLLLSNNWDWDYQVGFAYTPGTVGNAAGVLQIGQLTKNNANYTHGITRLYTNGLERLTIIANGNIGIGTSSPNSKLNVIAGNTPGVSIQSNNSGQYAYLYVGRTANDLSVGVSGGTDQFFVGTVAGDAIIKKENGNKLMLGVGSGAPTITINSSNFVGIGTTSPTASLHVNSTTAGATLIRADGTNGTLFSVVDDLSDSLMSVNNSAGLPVFEVFADDRIVAGQYGQNDFVIVNNKVGIGTNNPIAELHVTSSTSIPSAVFLGGNVGVGTSSPGYKLDVAGSLGINASASDTNWPFVVSDNSSAGSRYALNKLGSMGFNYADTYAQLQLLGAAGGYLDFSSVAGGDSNARLIYYAGSRLDLTYGFSTTLTLTSTNVGIGTTVPRSGFQINTVNGSSGNEYAGLTVSATVSASRGVNIAYDATNDIGVIASVHNGVTWKGLSLNPQGGYVGIGTISPTYKLQIGTVGSLADSIRIGTYQVAKNTRQYIGYSRHDSGLFESSGQGDTPSTVLGGVSGIRIVNTEGTLYAPQADNSVQILTHIYNGGSRIALHAHYDGNIGIGTVSPTVPLHVVGVISGSSFSGAGTGLTGTAAGLSIGGNAATSTIVNGTNGQLLFKDIRAIAPNNIAAGYLQFGFTTWANSLSTSPYADYLHLRSYTDSSGGNDNLVMFRKDVIGMRIWQQSFGSATNYSTYKDVAFTDQIGNGTITIAAGTGVGVGTTNTFTTNQSGATTVTISNTGVTSAVAGTGVSVSGATGAVTFSIGQAVGTGNTPSFAGIVSSAVTNYAFLQVTDTNNFWITPGNANWGLYFETTAGGLLGGTGDSNRLGFVGSGTARFYVDLNNGNGWFGGTLTAAGNISAANLSGTNTGDQTVGNGTITIAAGTGISVASNTFTTNQTGNSTVTVTNSGVTSNVAGTGISVSGATGAVTITNSGVTSAVAGTGVGVSAATGAVTFSIGQAVGTGNTPTFAGATLNGQLNVNHSVSTAIVRLWNAGSTVWSLGVGDTAGSYFNISADFGSILINKTNGNIWISGSGINNTVLHSGTTSAPNLSIGGNAATATTATNANAISFTEVELNAPVTVSGTWNTGTGSDWGEPKFGTSFNQYRYADGNGPYVEYNIPANHHSCFISQLQWDTGGYADCHGVQSDGDLVFLRRINTRQLIENSNHGNTVQHDGATVTFVGSGLQAFTKIRITNRLGRIHMTGIAFTRQIDDGYEGTGMVHPAQISHQGAGSGLDADLLDGYSSATANTANTIVLRDASGNFSAGTITATLSGTATTATTANALNTSNSYTGVNFTATGFFQTNLGQIKSDTSFALLTTSNGAQSVSVRGILLGTSYDTTPGANEIRTTNNTSLFLNARGTGDIQFQTADSLKMMLLNNGNVGVGVSNPSRKLDVEGIVRTRGASGTGGFEIGAATTGAARWRIEWDSASDSLDFNWVA